MVARIHIPLVVLLSTWFGVIAPLHERGAVTLPGTGCNAAAACATPSQSNIGCNACPTEKGKAPKPNPSRNCAVCHHMGLLDAAAPVFTVPCLAFAGILPAPAYAPPCSADAADLNRQRGPPISHVG